MNWGAWILWANEHQSRALFLIFLLLGASPALFAPVAGFKLLQVSRRFQFPLARYIGYALIGLGVQRLCSLIANIDGPVGVHYSLWFAWWFWIGQGIEWMSFALLSWYVVWPTDTDKQKKN